MSIPARDLYGNPVSATPERPAGLAGLAEIRRRYGLSVPEQGQMTLRPAAPAAPAPAPQAPTRPVMTPRRPGAPIAPPTGRAPVAPRPLSGGSAPARGGLGALRAAAAAAKPAPADGYGYAPAVNREKADPNDPFAGRGAPPPEGSGWLAILNWACRGTIDPTSDDVRIAFQVWSGRLVVSDEFDPGYADS